LICLCAACFYEMNVATHVAVFPVVLGVWAIISSLSLFPLTHFLRNKSAKNNYCSKIDFELWITNRHTYVMRLWLSFGYHIDWERVNEHGRTYLHLACMGDNADVVKLLFEFGGLTVLNRPDFNNDTPLHLAISSYRASKNAAIIDLLLEKGADPTLRTKKGHDAVRLSVVLNETDLIQKLFDFANEKEEMEEIMGTVEEEEEISGPLNERKFRELRKKEMVERKKKNGRN